MRTLMLLSLLVGCDPMPSVPDGGDGGEVQVLRASCHLEEDGPRARVAGFRVPEGAMVRAYLCETGMECTEVPTEEITIGDIDIYTACTVPVDANGAGQWVRFEIY